MDFDQQIELRQALAESARTLRSLNLNLASKWSAEALNGMRDLADDEKYARALMESRTQRSGGTPSVSFLPKLSTEEETLEFAESDKLLLASSYFSCKEFDRCSHVLEGCHSHRAIFLRVYSLYLSGERRRDFDSNGVLGQNDGKTQNARLPEIATVLKRCKDANGRIDDPFLLYMAGLVALKSKDVQKAQEYIYQSITLYPFNWGCWQELLSSISTFSEAVTILARFARNSRFTDSKVYRVMLLFFEVIVYQEFFQSSSEALGDLNYLLELFPRLSFLKVQRALVSYNALDYVAAESIFDSVLASDPLRLDDMDTYSNILYVMEKKPKLAFLAQHALKIDPLRPETCCIVANYYSLKFDHQKAIMYYRRALALNRNCLSAWTLMGHEFVELKNSHAAIESYRRAVDTNNKDFRAWYGLGQAYEVLDMNLYSLYYYQRACALKPTDKRMWQAIGNCCEKLGEFEDAVKSYRKALNVSSEIDPAILYKLASLYGEMGDTKSTKLYMTQCVNEETMEGVTDETSKARLWLAKHELDSKNWQLAYKYASELTHGTSHDIEEARAIARKASEMMKGL
ncbi:DEKNAAC100730 [Brettanomyces naardenensis]|uniref:DEKNAAC100730 n=1 Tax=Brettanomyces naardenensis TaxID=13370 RepID=A0A448YEI4_BRENA|nr:DEKNAAC100730 [Brettanomyces naardenensis]